MNNQVLKKIWVCNDVWMDIFPCFDHAQLGLKLALLSPRFNALVDKHFDGKNELTIWRQIIIRRKDSVNVTTRAPQLFVFGDNSNSVPFPLPDCPLPSKIRFSNLHIEHIDHSVVAFLRANKQIFDRSGTDLYLNVFYAYKHDDMARPIRDVFVHEIWPIFATNIRCLHIQYSDHLDSLRALVSPTILNIIHTIDSGLVTPNATSAGGQALAKWLHTPTNDGQPKRLRCRNLDEQGDWINNFKEKFLDATTCVSYTIQFTVHAMPTLIVPFDSVNVRTQEKLTLSKASGRKREKRWIMKRCKIGETTAEAAVQWGHKMSNNLNNIHLSGHNMYT